MPRYEDDSTIHVTVGSKKASFNVHKRFVCNASPFFQSACNSLFKEAMDKEVYLPKADPEAFDIFMGWLYMGNVKFPTCPIDKTSVLESGAYWLSIANTYLLASYLQCTAFGNALLDSVSRIIRDQQVTILPSPEVINLVYESTISDCGLRRLFIAINVWQTTPKHWAENSPWRSYLQNLPVEYCHDLIAALHKKNHHGDQDPLANDKASQVFRDTEVEWQAAKPPSSIQTKHAHQYRNNLFRIMSEKSAEFAFSAMPSLSKYDSPCP